MVGKKCEGCGTVCKNNALLLKHMTSKHSLATCKNHIVYCGTCRKPFANDSHLNAHYKQSWRTKTSYGRYCYSTSDMSERVSTLQSNNESNSNDAHQQYVYASEQEDPIALMNSRTINNHHSIALTSRSVGKILRFSMIIQKVIK